MKLGAIYVLWTRSWLELMRRLDRLREEREQSRAEVASLNERLAESRQRIERLCAEQEQARAEVETLRERMGMSRWPVVAPLAGPSTGEASPAPTSENHRLIAVPRGPVRGSFEEPPSPSPSRRAMIGVLDGWTTSYVVDGITVGGMIPLYEAPCLRRQLELIGGAGGKRALELGPLEAAHTRILCEQGAREVIAVEGFREAWLRCLVVKEVFGLNQARFLYGDFCAYVAEYQGAPFDFVLAQGVLYHQRNAPELIHRIARLTDCVLVWSQAADENHPGGPEVSVEANGKSYRGRVNDYGGARSVSKNYCGGVHSTAVWLYPDELRRAFWDAGFTHLADEHSETNPNGPTVQFVASKVPLGS